MGLSGCPPRRLQVVGDLIWRSYADAANWSLDADAYASETTAFALFERFGMQPVRYWYEMAADLSAAISPRPRPDLPVVSFSANYTAALFAAHNEAMAAGYVLAGEEASGRIRMNEIGTRRAWRRQGLAGSLLAEVMLASATDGQQRATLGVDSDSPTGAVSIYRRAGFEVVSSWTSYRRSLD
jgi:mycothiol synthase